MAFNAIFVFSNKQKITPPIRQCIVSCCIECVAAPLEHAPRSTSSPHSECATMPDSGMCSPENLFRKNVRVWIILKLQIIFQQFIFNVCNFYTIIYKKIHINVRYSARFHRRCLVRAVFSM